MERHRWTRVAGLLVLLSAGTARAEPAVVLEPVVVSPAVAGVRSGQASASLSVIDGDTLVRRRFHNLGDGLKEVEGVDVSRGGKAGGANIRIRGMPADYTLILIDGKRLNQSASVRPNGFGDVDSHFIPPASAIERIEVMRGAMAVQYGADALGGVVNIITRKTGSRWGGSFQLDGTLSLNRAFDGDQGGTLYASGPLKAGLLGLAVRAGATHRDGADIRYADRDGRTVTPGFNGFGAGRSDNFGLRLTLTPDPAHELLLDIDRARLAYSNRRGELGTLNESVPARAAGGGYAPDMAFDRDRYALTHLGRWGAVRSETSLLHDRTATQGRTRPMRWPRRADDGQPRRLEHGNLTLDSRLVAPWPDAPHRLTAGGQYWQQRLHDTLADNPQSSLTRRQWAVFAEDEWRLSDRLALMLGLRHEHIQAAGGQWSPRASLRWNADAQWTVRGGISRGHKPPRLNQTTPGIIGLGRQGTLPLLGNPQLKPETAILSELGVGFDTLRGRTASATLFHTRFGNKIESVRLPNCRAKAGRVPGCVDVGPWTDRRGRPVTEFSQSANIGAARLFGLELATRQPLGAAWSATLNYTLTDSRQLTGRGRGHPFGDQPRHMANARLDWTHGDAARLWLGASYRAGQYRGLAPARRPVSHAPYLLFDLGGSYAFGKSVALSAALYNLLDKNFVDYGPNPLSPEAAAYVNAYQRIQEGRRLWLSATLRF